MIHRFSEWIGSPEVTLVSWPQSCALRQPARYLAWREKKTALAADEPSEGNFLKIGRDGDFPAELARDFFFERCRRARLAVDRESLLRGLCELAEPAQNFSVVGVRAQVFHRLNSRADRHVLAVDFYRLRARLDGLSSRTRRLETDEEDRVPVVRQAAREVVEHAAARRHAAG